MDAFVSLWHFARGIKINNNPNLPIDVAFELYCKGRSNCVPYWDHVLRYWKASQESPESLKNLSNLEVNKTGKYGDAEKGVENKVYFRKGKIGDWKNHLTPEMGEQLDNIMEEKLSGSGFTFREPN
ncbi:hypothetical protein PTKIN_Ptkin13bG0234000 [Pterospermum kingtungense]